MTQYDAGSPHQPKGDHNRRLSLGLDADRFAAEAGITPEQLQAYERTPPDSDFDPEIAQRIEATLDRLEQTMPNHQTGRGDAGQPSAPGHENHTRLGSDELRPSILEGATIYDTSNRKLGSVSHVHGTGPSAEVIIDVGGFFGLGAKPVAIPVSELDFMRDDNGHVHAVTGWTEEQLRNLPEHRHH